jgi:hypothetical protein
MLRALQTARLLSYRRILVPSSVSQPLAHRQIFNNRRYESALRCPHSTPAETQEGLLPPPANHDASSFLSANYGIPRGDIFLNTADRLEEQLRSAGHRVWGPTVYRCTYGDDAAWATCLDRLRASIRESMEFYHALELLDEDRFRMTVFDEASEFDGAGAERVRRHFKTWREQAFGEEQDRRHFKTWRERAFGEEQGTHSEEVETQGQGDDFFDPVFGTRATRYRFCIQIDEPALQSILSPTAESRESTAWVNVIQADWDPEAAAAAREQDRIDHLAMDMPLESLEDCFEEFPEIDGCTDENIGWMRVHYQGLVPHVYAELNNPDTLVDIYVRPPGVLDG